MKKSLVFALLIHLSCIMALSQQADTIVHSSQLNNITRDIVKLIREQYVFPSLAEGLSRNFEKWMKDKNWPDNTSSTVFCEEVSSWLKTTTNDKHFVFQQASAKTAGAVKLSGWYMAPFNYGVAKLEWFPPHTGYIEYRGFNFTMIPDAKKKIDLIMDMFRDAQSIIIDLRQNRGGDGSMANYIFSYFMPEDSVALYNFDNRRDGKITTTTGYTFKTLPSSRLVDKKLYVLVSTQTGSTAELFAFLCQKFDRATIIGEVTAGAGHNMSTFRVAEKFTLGIPTGRFYDPETNFGWQEMGGIQPDIIVDKDKALEKAKELIGL